MRLTVLVGGSIHIESVVAPRMLISAAVAVATIALEEEFADHHHRRVATETGMDLLLKD